MAHELESMMYLNGTPWHGLGTHLETAPTSAEAIKAAGLDWGVSLVSLVSSLGDQVDTHRAVRRTTDGRILGVVGNDYTPLQNHEAFNFFDPFITANEATYETAGSLRDGARIWILAKINRAPSVIVKGDEVEKYVLLSNAHDGKLAVRVGFTPIRVVCANTLRLAHINKASKLIRVNHTANVALNVEALRNVMNLANAEFEATAEQYRALARMDINAADLERYITSVFYPTKTLELKEGEASKSRIVKTVVELFETGKGNNLPGVRGTMWGAYNAVTEYLSYKRGNDSAVRLNNLWFGDSVQVNQRALDVACDFAKSVAC